ncbi:MAG: SulP family inorganic anion transporter [Thermoanaerobaculia bacterium]
MRTTTEIVAGLVTATFLIASTVSYAAAVFSGPLAALLPVGIGYGLLGAAVSATIFALGSRIPFAVGGPDSKSTAVLALMAISIAMSTRGPTGRAPNVETAGAVVLFVLAASSVVSGLALYFFGRLRIGRWIRFVPFPVVGGFMAASGWLLIVSAVRILTRLEPGWSTLPQLAAPGRLARVAASILFAAAFAATERSRRSFAFPVLLFGLIGLAHAGRILAGVSLVEAQASGWLLNMPHGPVVPIAWLFHHWSSPPAALLLDQVGGNIALVVVTAFTLLLGITSIEVDTRLGDDIDVDRELQVNGVANVAAGLVGGMAGTLSLSRTLFNYRNGARGRLGGMIAAALCLATLAFGTGALGWVPVPILGGMLLRVGFDLLNDWFLQGWRRMDRADYAQVVIILLGIAFEGFIAGVALGVIAACVTFAINTSRVGLVKQEKDRSQYGSRVLRSVSETRELVRNGRAIQIIWLQGFIFFGSVNTLLQHVKRTVAAQGPRVCSMVILDFRQVLGIDTSAIKILVKARQFAEREGFLLVFSGLGTRVGGQLRSGGLLRAGDKTCRIFRELDAALEWCEDRVLEERISPEEAKRSSDEWLTHEIGSETLFQQLVGYLETISYAAGDVLFVQGDPAEFLCLISSGRVSVILRSPEGNDSRLRSMQRHTIVGEMGLYRTAPRGARVLVDQPTIVYRLSRQALDRMETENSKLALAFHRFVVRTLADRLEFANRETAAFQS